MTVEELIKILQDLPQDLPVFYRRADYFDYPASVAVHWMNEYDIVDPEEVEEGEDISQAVIIW